MKIDNLEEALQPMTVYAPLDQLIENISRPLRFFSEAEVFKALIPSYALGDDGVTLDRVFLFSSSLICDIRPSPTGSAVEFDFVSLQSVANYRYNEWTHEIKVQDVVQASFELATIKWIHGFDPHLITSISYAGDAEGRKLWLTSVLNAVPLNSLMLQY